MCRLRNSNFRAIHTEEKSTCALPSLLCYEPKRLHSCRVETRLMKMRLKTTFTLAAMFSQVVLCSCKNDSLRVNLAQGFMGDVQINCGRWKEPVKPISVGLSGRVDDAVCPLHQTSLTVMRDGNIVRPVENVIWEAAGDGTIVQIRFTIR
jgi:hypothetical protein